MANEVKLCDNMDYWNAQEKRYKDYTSQTSLFSGVELQKEMFKET